MAKSSSVLRIRQVRSKIGQSKKQREALRTLGLRRIGQVVERPDNAAVRGTVRAVGHLVRLEGEQSKAPAPAEGTQKTAKKTTKKTTKKAAEKTAKKTAKKATGGKKTTKKATAGKKTTKEAADSSAETEKTTTKKKASGGEP